MRSRFLSLQYDLIHLSCRNPHCSRLDQSLKPGEIIRNGSFWRSSDGRRVQRYICAYCRRGFSSSTLHPCYRQKKRQLNLELYRELVSHTSQRRAALKLGLNRNTVVRKFLFLEKCAEQMHAKFLLSQSLHSRAESIQCDEMRSSIHTKLKPVSIPIVVEPKNRWVLGIDVCSMPANGNLAAISVKKYGQRADHRAQTLTTLMRSLTPFLSPQVHILSDQDVLYPRVISRVLKHSRHKTVKSRRAHVAGQGEMKIGGRDPLFSLNHACAMFRANVNRLIRRTWCTSKRIDRLKAHLTLYMVAHNQMIEARFRNTSGRLELSA